MVLAVHVVIWLLGVIAVLSVVGLVLIVVAPWRRVRAEPPLPEDVESRLLLGESPEAIAEDVEARAAAAPPPPVDLTRRQRDSA
ncbi:MAG: hypothetical protein ACRDWD_01970 [Acidimicrobiia bacterium]